MSHRRAIAQMPITNSSEYTLESRDRSRELDCLSVLFYHSQVIIYLHVRLRVSKQPKGFFIKESVSKISSESFWQSRKIDQSAFLSNAVPELRSRGEGLVRVPSGAGGTRCTVSVIRRGLRSPRLPTRCLGGWTPPRRFGITTRDVAPPPRGTPNPHLVSVSGA